MPAHFRFKRINSDGAARLSVFHTPHGAIHMPAFAPVGTLANVKTLEPRDLAEAGCELVLANTYHLYLRPGHELIERLGGLHTFMAYDGPILTDSGGYQVFSLAHNRRLDDDGVTFRSHVDGSLHRFTPESVMAVEQALGPDIAMVLDECPNPLDRAANEQALARTHRWAERCKAAHTRPTRRSSASCRAASSLDPRQTGADFLTALDFPGYAIAAAWLWARPKRRCTPRWTKPARRCLPISRALMGVGAPEDIVEAVYRGVDMFDCVLPTRIAQRRALHAPGAHQTSRNAQYAEDLLGAGRAAAATPVAPSRAYLRHLYKARDQRIALRHHPQCILHARPNATHPPIRRPGCFADFRADL